MGVLSRSNLLEHWVSVELPREAAADPEAMGPIIAYDLLHQPAITAYPLESCRAAAERMAERGAARLVMASPDNPNQIVGIVTRGDLLKPRARSVEEERKHEQFLGTNLVPTSKQHRQQLGQQ